MNGCVVVVTVRAVHLYFSVFAPTICSGSPSAPTTHCVGNKVINLSNPAITSSITLVKRSSSLVRLMMRRTTPEMSSTSHADGLSSPRPDRSAVEPRHHRAGESGAESPLDPRLKTGVCARNLYHRAPDSTAGRNELWSLGVV